MAQDREQKGNSADRSGEARPIPNHMYTNEMLGVLAKPLLDPICPDVRAKFHICSSLSPVPSLSPAPTPHPGNGFQG